MESGSRPTSTRRFRMSAARFAAEMIFRYAWAWLLLLSIVGVTGLVLGLTLDIRWLVSGLLIIFVAAPSLLAFLYYFYALRREGVVNYLLHTLTIDPERGLVVTLYLDDETIREEIFSWKSMDPYKVGSNSAVIPLRTPQKGFIWIPASAFGSETDMVAFFKALDNYL